MKALVIGRHLDGTIPGVEIVGQQAFTFAARSEDILPQLVQLETAALNAGADTIILQNTPGQLTAALMQFKTAQVAWYVVVSGPGERPEMVVVDKEFFADDQGRLEDVAELVDDIVRAANPRAVIRTSIEPYYKVDVHMEVTPPMPFVFSHLERLL